MTAIKDKVSHVLEESRVILPGTQALLGFQFIAFFSNGFEKLPAAAQKGHLLSLLFVIASTIFLMSSAAYHRIVEEGEDTVRFHRFASYMVMCAMVMLAIGVALDVCI